MHQSRRELLPRMYDPALGRFTSADTIVTGGAQGLDRYAYVNNSPVNFTDPTGHKACDDELGCGGSSSTGGSSGGGNDNTPNTPEIITNGIYGPPDPNVCYRNTVYMDTPSVDLHPSDVVNPLVVGIVIVYSDSEKIIGYRYITATSDYQNYTFHWEILNFKYIFRKFVEEATTNLIEKNFELLGKTVAAAGFKKLTTALFVYDLAQLGNQLVSFESTSMKTGPIIPQRILPPMPDHADPHGYFGIP